MTKRNMTVKSNLGMIIKTHYIKIREIDFRNVSNDIKVNELRKIQDSLQGTIAVIEHTGSYIEEMSALLSIKRDLYSIMQKYIPDNEWK